VVSVAVAAGVLLLFGMVVVVFYVRKRRKKHGKDDMVLRNWIQNDMGGDVVVLDTPVNSEQSISREEAFVMQSDMKKASASKRVSQFLQINPLAGSSPTVSSKSRKTPVVESLTSQVSFKL
jgi:hypothetical protein